MRTFFAVIVITIVYGTAALPPAAQAQGSDEASSIRATIGAQLDAIQQDDWDRAFSYASPGIQGVFGDPETFSQMVRGGYPMVWRPQSVEYGELRMTPGGPAQRMIFVGPDGQLYFADYYMEQTDGVWRIKGVQLVEGDELAA